MSTRDCPICGQQFGHAWGGVGRVAHMWNVHGIPGKTTFNNKVIEYPPKKDSCPA